MADRKVVFITGGNTGLGLEIVKALAASETAYELFIGCRTVSKGEDAVATIEEQVPNTVSTFSIVQTDLSSDTSLETAVQTLTDRSSRIDILINNGGAQYDALVGQGKMSLRGALNASWDTNVSGTHVLTTLAIPLLVRSADPRILFITSGTSSLTETERLDTPAHARLNASPDRGWPKSVGGPPSFTAYRSVKTGLNMLMRGWHRILRHDDIKVWAVSPGFLATGLGGFGSELLKKMGAKDPAEGGRLVRAVAEGEHDKSVGNVVRADGIQDW